MKTISRLLSLFAAAIVFAFSTACDNITISGEPGEVLVVIPADDWDGALGQAVQDSLGREFPFIYGEQLYKMVHVMPSGFGKTFQMHRNILQFVIDGSSEGKVEYLSDQWAHPQCVIRITARSSEEARKLFSSSSSRIIAYLDEAERARAIDNCTDPTYEDPSVGKAVSDLFGGSPHFMKGFKLKGWTQDFLWISSEDVNKSKQMGVMMHTYPALGEAFSRDSLLSHTSSMLRSNVPGMVEGSYMAISEHVEAVPSLVTFQYGGRDITEIRGRWNVVGDFMGGPFVAHAFPSQDGKNVMLLFGYMYYPNSEKPKNLRKVQAMLYSFEWKK